MLQNIAAGDSILAPAGRAWCQLADEVTLDSNLAVLKLLVPGNFPHKTDSQQGNEVTQEAALHETNKVDNMADFMPASNDAALNHLAHIDTKICCCRSD